MEKESRKMCLETSYREHELFPKMVCFSYHVSFPNVCPNATKNCPQPIQKCEVHDTRLTHNAKPVESHRKRLQNYMSP